MKGILATVLVMCMVGVSYADTLRGNRENCSHLGHVIRDIADARDNGALYEVVGPLTDAQIDDAMGKPGSIVNDKDDAKYIRATVKEVWGKYKDMGPQEAGISAFLDCMHKPI